MPGQTGGDGGLDAALGSQLLILLHHQCQAVRLVAGHLLRLQRIQVTGGVQPVHGAGEVRQLRGFWLDLGIGQTGGFVFAFLGIETAVIHQGLGPGHVHRLPGALRRGGAFLRGGLGGGQGSLLFGAAGSGFNGRLALLISALDGVPVLADVLPLVVVGVGLIQLQHGLVHPDGVKGHGGAVFGSEVLHALAILVFHRTVGTGAPACEELAVFGELAAGQIHGGVINGRGGLHIALTARGLIPNVVGIGLPLGIQVRLVAIHLCSAQIAHLLTVCIGGTAAVRPGIPAREVVAGAGESGLGQLELLAVFAVQRVHAAHAAVGVKPHGIAVGHPAGVNGLAVARDVFLPDGLGVLAVIEPFRPLRAHDGILLQKVLGVHLQAGHVGQDQGTQVVVAAHEAAVLQLGVMAHVQSGELVISHIQPLQHRQLQGETGQLVGTGVQIFQLSEIFDALQAGDSLILHVDGGHSLQLLLGEHTVLADAVQVLRAQEPGAEGSVGEILLADLHALLGGCICLHLLLSGHIHLHALRLHLGSFFLCPFFRFGLVGVFRLGHLGCGFLFRLFRQGHGGFLNIGHFLRCGLLVGDSVADGLFYDLVLHCSRLRVLADYRHVLCQNLLRKNRNRQRRRQHCQCGQQAQTSVPNILLQRINLLFAFSNPQQVNIIQS